ncbi:MAG: hypothetical protein ACRD4X_17565 [Candidatus Acidiferrales bacterium]
MTNRDEMVGAAVGLGFGAIIATVGGFVWFGWSFSAFRSLPLAVFAAYFSVAVTLMTFAVIVLRRGRKMMKALGVVRSDFWQKRRKAFGTVVALEIVGCIIVLVLVAVFHRPAWTAVGISLVVGLHFIALGSIFAPRGRLWYSVGGSMVGWDILTVTALRSWNPTASAAIAAGMIMWAAAIYLLLLSLRMVPRERPV